MGDGLGLVANGTAKVVSCEANVDGVEDRIGVVFGEPSVVVVVGWFGLEVLVVGCIFVCSNAVCDSKSCVDDAISDDCEWSESPGDDVPEVDGFRACEVFGTLPGAAVGVVC